ncbi:hypothetical protein PVL29_001584 [Vitis rotundifolia]|uniref:Uncharacterized protein n=1 Tax=Vitis rotundifolia TaxID=103349 RepID=A0AA39AED3_VITRO|nr:hypothetical protein PVL29_001584 [Vitis rotundifolia]
MIHMCTLILLQSCYYLYNLLTNCPSTAKPSVPTFASHISSVAFFLQVGPYNPAVTPTSSLDFKGGIGESSYSLKTSTDLLKVLNRIWSLEEQHASNVSLIKALKMELGQARARIKRLLRDQQAERHEIDDLMKQVEDKLLRKSSKEQDRVNSAVQSVRDELENERKLRKHSESLHRKLARELSEVKSSFSNAMKELEKERKSRELLEDLCDEFAKGIRDYQQEVHALKQKSDSDWAGRADHDRLILHLSESWLDERMQTKLVETQLGSAENNPILDKLSFEIETFLQAKQMHTSKTNSNMLPREPTKERYLRRNSLESVPLHDAVSAPQDPGDEEASAGSETNCFELNKPTTSNFKPHGDEPEAHTDRMIKSKKKLVPHERIKGRNPSSLQVKFEEQMARAMACNGNKTTQVVDTDQQRKISEGIPLEASITPKPENCEATEDRSYERKIKHDAIIQEPNLNYDIDSLIRSQYLSSEAGNIRPENDDDCGEASFANSAWRSHGSPVREWMVKLTSPDLDIPESSSKLVPKENTLKAKLLEARLKGKRSRLKATNTKVSL